MDRVYADQVPGESPSMENSPVTTLATTWAPVRRQSRCADMSKLSLISSGAEVPDTSSTRPGVSRLPVTFAVPVGPR